MQITDEQIADFAWDQFCKFGLNKTTMKDIADRAGISRQSLYNRFQNKNELLRLVAKLFFQKNLKQCEIELSSKTTLPEILDTLIKYFVINVWKTVKSLPEGEDFELSPHTVISEEVRLATNDKITLISKVLFQYIDNATNPIKNSNDLARYFCASASGIKSLANDEAELLSLSQTLKLSFQSYLFQMTK